MTALILNREKWRSLTLRQVPIAAPFGWLAQSWHDIRSHTGASLAYGLAVAVPGLALLAYPMHPYVLAALLTLFMLTAPVLAAGLIALSRAHSRQESVSFDASLIKLREHRRPLLRFALLLACISALWFAVSAAVLAEIFGSAASPLAATMMGDVLQGTSTGQLSAYVSLGAILAAVVFVLSVVTVPAIIDRGCGVRQAMATSVRAVFAADFPALALWAALCVILVAFGFASLMLGMAIVFPLLGHASWYAYQDLVK